MVLPKKIAKSLKSIPLLEQRIKTIEDNFNKGDEYLKEEFEKFEAEIKNDVHELSDKMSSKFSQVYDTINGMKGDISDIRVGMSELVGTAKAILEINKGELK